MTNPRRKPAVMYDVARLAGVSHQTVSRVINGSEHVRAETRDRVLAAMRQLDYRPNSQARALVTGRSRTRRRDHLRHGALRPGLDARQHRPRRARRGLLRQRRQRRDARPCGDRPARASGCATLGVDGILVIAPHVAATSALWDLPVRPAGRGRRGRPRRGRPGRRRRPVPGRAAGHRAPAGPGPRDRPPHRRPARLDRGPAARRRLARRAGGGRRAQLDAAAGRLEPALRVRARAPAARARRRHGGLRGQRPDGARPAALPQRAGPRRARATSA